MTANGSAGSTKPEKKTRTPIPRKDSWFQLPTPVRHIFDRFPLVTYSANQLPQRVLHGRNEHVLYIFRGPQETSVNGPSCNPSCLKWQAFLQFRQVRLRLRASNNHASPTGALPFLLPASETERPKSPVSASRLPRWITSQGGEEEGSHIQEEAYMALIDHNIRNAWLHYLYVDPGNFRAVAWPLYVETSSRSLVVQQATARQLRSAALEELSKNQALVDGQEIYENANRAFAALSTLLGTKYYFFGNEKPGLFDASLFAYTHLLLDLERKWKEKDLLGILGEYDNLVEHRNRILSHYFDG